MCLAPCSHSASQVGQVVGRSHSTSGVAHRMSSGSLLSGECGRGLSGLAIVRSVTRPPYLDVLARLHDTVRPRTYLEIGIRNGWSLAQARSDCAILGIDPEFFIDAELSGRVRLRRTTSDAYFATEDPTDWLGAPIDMAFIDGMHLAEFALRDFIHVERHCRPGSIIVFDDMLPRSVDEAARDRHTQAWTGDVFRVREILAEQRPDLELTLLDTDPTGLLLVTGLDPQSTILSDRFDEIVAAHVRPDPQAVPQAIFDRADAMEVDEAFGALAHAFEARARSRRFVWRR